jgi:ATP-dependent Lon protease
MLEHLSHAVQTLRVKRDIDMTVRDHLSRSEKEAVLRHKMRAIKRELAVHEESPIDELGILRDRIDAKDLSSLARDAAQRELDRLSRMNPESGEATIARTYVEWLADLPWGDADAEAERVDLEDARARLEAGHHGLEKVKRRVIEHLAVRKLVPNKRGPILCFAGPPGVGKTSLGRAIADTLGRPFVRLSLGGVRDDAELRGHRRTYVGAQPGRFVQAMKRAGRSNPVFLLDEVDKVAQNPGRGDAIGVLLEALDPEQNDSFEDHYLGVPYDLSRVSFICTANELGAIPPVLRDRLEVIEIGGYVVAEKVQIARTHLLPKIRAEHGLQSADAFDVTDEALEELATRYTRESGVRGLQRKLEALVRDHAMQIAERKSPPSSLDVEACTRILGAPRFSLPTRSDAPRLGVVTGLGWTPTGGRLLFIEATRTPGDGRLRLTGRLGDVMKESGQAALSLIRSDPPRFGAAVDLQRTDIHAHFPEGAIPKDGPSAGIGLVTALASSISNRPVRNDLAMTGEVTLRGNVLPVGGIREKVLAAHRAGIRTIILPAGNRKDEPEIPEAARAELTLHYVHTVDEVIALALVPPAAA